MGLEILQDLRPRKIVGLGDPERDDDSRRRKRGLRFIWGLAVYALVCSVGNLSNYSLAKLLVDHNVWWPLAGLSGMAVGSVWNFAASSILTWRKPSTR